MGRNLGVEYKMRMNWELKEKIAEAAKANNRSMNAEIIHILEKALDDNSEKPIINIDDPLELRRLAQLTLELSNLLNKKAP